MISTRVIRAICSSREAPVDFLPENPPVSSIGGVLTENVNMYIAVNKICDIILPMILKTYTSILLGLLCVLLFPAAAAAQSAAAMDTLLDEEILTFGSSSYLVLAAVGEISDETGRDRAADEIGRRIFYFSGKTADDPVTLGEFSFLLMAAAERSGGLMYRFFPGPRYAARELAFHGVIQGNAYPNVTLSGERALRIIERFLTRFGDEV
jgi:hypothetical protein